MSDKKEKYDVVSVKIAPDKYELLNAICDALGVNSYQIFQMFFSVLAKAASPMHKLSPEIQKLMTLMETDAGWAEAFNLANPDKLKVAQCVLILEQEGHKGFGAVMVDKPFFGDAHMTWCVDDIMERVCEVCMYGIYKRLREVGGRNGYKNLSDILLTMIDAQTIDDLNRMEQEEIKGEAMFDARGRRIEYGKKTKAKQHRTPDSYANDQRIREQPLFDDFDRHPYPAGTTLEDWEGEHVDVKIKEKWK